ncbi:CD209 antigen-like protein E isoform X2 [Xiphophorus hellerii]|uniref:CD209 antigen-like protein E isoform X2 n=1 Tax=Xiphophorus hellerii TaxID=8084 RepID=UPI0013B4627A|nr:CD209 antigen-like protein E isoform X2 [Xiphophorus hellerii]
MARAVRREPADFGMDYVNLPEPSVTMAAGGGDEGNRSAPVKSDGQTSPTGPACSNETVKQEQLIKRYIQRGWVRFHSSVYYISFNRNTWQQSRRFCLQQGADLVIINTKEEQDFTRQFNRLTWLGLHNKTKTGNWTWVDGTPLTKSYWGPGEPNGFEGKMENCVEIRFFELENSWNDIPCGDENYWICEKEVAP